MNTRRWLAWHLLVAAGILGIATLVRDGTPLLKLPPDQWAFILALPLTHMAGALALWWQAVHGARPHVIRAAITMLATYGLFALGWLMASVYYSRWILGVSLILSVLLTVIALVFARHLHRILLPALALGVVAVGGAIFARYTATASSVNANIRTTRLSTTFNNLKLTVSRGHIDSDVPGGSIRLLSPGVLIAEGHGALYYLEELSQSDELVVRRLPYHVPINHEEFWTDTPTLGTDRFRFRIGDIFVYVSGTSVKLLVSHHYWRTEPQCFVMRVSMTEAERNAFVDGTADIEWSTLFETEPCLPIRTERRATEGPFSGHMLGGRFAAIDERTVLLSVGDHAFDGLNSELILAQDDSARYGKIIQIDVETGAWEIYSTGHRNPQGLSVSADGLIWSTEHGPQGGDELNLIRRGSNYGWPFETFGAQYGEMEWPLSAHQGRHTDYEAPVFSWVPSVAVSDLIIVERDLFTAWQGDLLVASLGGSLFRLRYLAGRIVFAEPIRLGGRIRDLVEAPDGRIVLLFDRGGLGILEPVTAHRDGPVRDAALLFASCQTCHQIGDGSVHGSGPDLRGVVDRPIASAADYPYSPALRDLSGRWTVERLERFLADPQEFAPGTTMEFAGIPDLSDRLLLIAWLRTNR